LTPPGGKKAFAKKIGGASGGRKKRGALAEPFFLLENRDKK
jgi:hypothetical protein